MATVLSVETVRNTVQRIVWTWIDAFGKTFGPYVDHAPVGADPQAFADGREAAELIALQQAEIAANLEEIAGA